MAVTTIAVIGSARVFGQEDGSRHVAAQPSPWHVTSFADLADSQPGDGACAAETAGCTLRAAIQEANARSGSDVVTLPDGRFVVSLEDPDGRSPADAVLDERTGDLDIRDALTIQGSGAERTIIDGAEKLPLLHAHRLVRLTVRGVALVRGAGTTTSGGCLRAEGPATVEAATFTGCTGRAVRASQPLTITASHFEANFIGVQAATWLVVRSTSFVRHDRGAIQADGPTWIDGASFVANRATVGSALDASGDLTVLRSSFEANRSTSGALSYSAGAERLATITDSAFISNTATAGAAINLGAGRMEITNTTFAANRGTGNSVVAASGALTLTHVTFHSGVLHVAAGGVVLRNTLLAQARCDLYGGTVISLGHNIEPSNTCGLNPALGDLPNTNAPPMVLADNGGPTLTMLPADGLGPAHPAIDAADPAACPATDQRGFPRPAGSACDVGAVERGAAPAVPATAAVPPVATAWPNERVPTPTTIVPDTLPAKVTRQARIGGAISDLVVWGELGARASGTGVTLLDVADPDAPRALGRLELDTLVTALAGPTGAGDLVALAGGALVRIDVRDPARPAVAARVDLPVLPGDGARLNEPSAVAGHAHDVAVSGTTIVVALIQTRSRAETSWETKSVAGIATFDLAAPAAGWQVVWQSGGQLPFVAVHDVAISDTRLFAVFQPEEPRASVAPTIVVVDRSNGRSGAVPLETWDTVAAIVPDGQSVWLAAEPPPPDSSTSVRTRGLMRFDSADAATPRFGISVTLPITIPVRGLALRDRTAWVLAATGGEEPPHTQLVAVDLDAPDLGAAELVLTFASYARVLAGGADRMLVGDGGGWVRVVTTAGRSARARGEIPDVGPAVAAEVGGGRLLTGGPGGAAQLTVIDVVNSEAPRWRAAWGRTSFRSWFADPIGLALEGDRAWVASGAGLSELGLADWDTPRMARTWPRRSKDVVRSDGRTWSVGQANFTDRGLVAVESDATGARRLIGPWFPALDFDSVAAGAGGQIVAISDRTVVAWSTDARGEPHPSSMLDLTLSPTYGAVRFPTRPCCTPEVAVRPGLGATAHGEVVLFDPDTTPELRLLGSIGLPSDSAEGVALYGTVAVIAAGHDGVVVVDVRTPARPVILAGADTPGYARRVALDWPTIYVADSDAGVAVLRYDGPAVPSDPATATAVARVTATPHPPTGTPVTRLAMAVWLPLATRP